MWAASAWVPQAPNKLDVMEQTAKLYPREFYDVDREGMTEHEQGAFIRILACVLHTQVDERFGLNGKRGSLEVSRPPVNARCS